MESIAYWVDDLIANGEARDRMASGSEVPIRVPRRCLGAHPDIAFGLMVEMGSAFLADAICGSTAAPKER